MDRIPLKPSLREQARPGLWPSRSHCIIVKLAQAVTSVQQIVALQNIQSGEPGDISAPRTSAREKTREAP